jgi:hypothetical protein
VSDTDQIDPEVKEAVDERVEWIEAVIADAGRRGGSAIQEAIDNLDVEDMPGLLFMLLSSYAHDVERLRELARDEIAEGQFEHLDGDNGDAPILH